MLQFYKRHGRYTLRYLTLYRVYSVHAFVNEE